MKDIVKPL